MQKWQLDVYHLEASFPVVLTLLRYPLTDLSINHFGNILRFKICERFLISLWNPGVTSVICFVGSIYESLNPNLYLKGVFKLKQLVRRPVYAFLIFFFLCLSWVYHFILLTTIWIYKAPLYMSSTKNTTDSRDYSLNTPGK